VESHLRAGWEVLPLASCRPPSGAGMAQAELEWKKKTHYRPSVLRQLTSILRVMITHPIRFLRILFWLARLAFRSPFEFAVAVHELGAACYFETLCGEFKAEHVHVHFASRSLSLGLMLGMLRDLPVSCTVHAFDIFTRNPRGLRMRLSQCRFIAAISRYNVEYLRQHCGDAVAGLCCVVHCGVNLAEFPAIERRPERGRILSVARLMPKKGLSVAIDACAELRDGGVGFLLDIVGGGPERGHLLQKIEAHGLGDRVRMLGAVPNDQLLGLFERAVFFLLPCVTEADGDQDGIPVAMMEAMACGVPTISTEISGIPELVEDGVNGVLVPQRDAQALASAMKRLLEDMDFAARLGEASRKRVCEEFDTEPNARLLRQLIASNKR